MSHTMARRVLFFHTCPVMIFIASYNIRDSHSPAPHSLPLSPLSLSLPPPSLSLLPVPLNYNLSLFFISEGYKAPWRVYLYLHGVEVKALQTSLHLLETNILRYIEHLQFKYFRRETRTTRSEPKVVMTNWGMLGGSRWRREVATGLYSCYWCFLLLLLRTALLLSSDITWAWGGISDCFFTRNDCNSCIFHYIHC